MTDIHGPTRPLSPQKHMVAEFILGAAQASLDRTVTEHRTRELVLARYRNEIEAAGGLGEETSYIQSLFHAARAAMEDLAACQKGSVHPCPAQVGLIVFRLGQQ